MQRIIMIKQGDVQMRDEQIFHIYCISILVRYNFNNLYYSDSEEINSDSEIQYYEYVCNEHELRDLCNLYNENDELVEISWFDQTSVNSQKTTTSAFTAASVMMT